MVVEHEKIRNIHQSISKSSSKSASAAVPIVYCKVLYKMISNQCTGFKDQFIAENGILVLKQLLKTFQEQGGNYEMYLYCLGMIPPLLSVSQRNTEDFMDAGFITLLSRHLIGFYEENQSNYFSIMTPLLLALKALVSSNRDMKEELSVNIEVVSVLYNTVCNSYGSRYNLLPLHISGTILMCELGHSVFS